MRRKANEIPSDRVSKARTIKNIGLGMQHFNSRGARK
jgi:hypothetical protein